MDAACPVESARPAAHAPVRGWAWWFAPDLALVVSVVALFYVLVSFDGTRQLLRDSDAGWHILTGEAILEGRGLPRVDSYSLLRSGEPWFAWEWGADLLMGFLHRYGGMAAVTGFFAVVIAFCVWLWFRLHAVLGTHFLVAAGLAPLLLMMTQIHWHARPHILSWVFILAAMHYAERRHRSLLVVAAGSALWANLHASFFFGAVIALVYAAGHFLRPLLWLEEERFYDWSEARWFVFAALVSAAATLLNPYGWRVHLHVFRYLADSELLARIGEFQTFNYYAEGALPVLVGMLVAGAGAVLAFSQRRLEHAFLAALLLALAMRSARGLPVAALLCLPVAGLAFTRALESAAGLREPVRRRIDEFLAYGRNLWRLDVRFRGPVFAAVVLLLVAWALQRPPIAARAGFSEQVFPVKAAAQIAKLPRTIRLLAPDLYGGYLIYRFRGELKVFFDGRSDFYGAQYMKDYLDLVELRAGWRERVEQIGFEYALLPKRYSLIPALEGIGWRRLYADETAVLLQAPPQTREK